MQTVSFCQMITRLSVSRQTKSKWPLMRLMILLFLWIEVYGQFDNECEGASVSGSTGSYNLI